MTIIVGNPKVGSRTRDAAERLHQAILGSTPPEVIEVAALGPGVLGFGDPGVRAAVERVAASSFVIVASPTFKATYTGLLKTFLDQFAGGEGMRNVVAVPLMLGAGPVHAMAPELLLKPVLVEVGAITPAPGLYLMDSTYGSDGRIDTYVQRWGATVRASIAAAEAERAT